MVRDESQREILFEIDRLRETVTRQLTDPEIRERITPNDSGHFFNFDGHEIQW